MGKTEQGARSAASCSKPKRASTANQTRAGIEYSFLVGWKGQERWGLVAGESH